MPTDRFATMREAFGEREKKAHLGIVAEDDQHLRGRIGRSVRAIVRERAFPPLMT